MKIWHSLLGPGLAAALVACSPTYNWREVRLPQDGLRLMLPCKPDSGSRRLMLAGQSVDVHMIGCEADATMFTLAYADMADADKANSALSEWKGIMLDNLQGKPGAAQESGYSVKAVPAPIPAVLVNTAGRSADGGMLKAQAIWFVRGARLYHGLALGKQLKMDAVDNFFSGIELE